MKHKIWKLSNTIKRHVCYDRLALMPKKWFLLRSSTRKQTRVVFQLDEICAVSANFKCSSNHKHHTQAQVKETIRLKTTDTWRWRSINTRSFEDMGHEPTRYHSNSLCKKLFVNYCIVRKKLSKYVETKFKCWDCIFICKTIKS